MNAECIAVETDAATGGVGAAGVLRIRVEVKEKILMRALGSVTSVDVVWTGVKTWMQSWRIMWMLED